MSGIAEARDHASAPAPLPRGIWRNAWRRGRGLVLPVLLLILWQVVSISGAVSPFILPTPLQVLAAFKLLAHSGLLASSTGISLQRLLFGYIIGVAVGLPLGLLLAVSKRARQIIAPSFYFVIRVPLVAWIPFLMIIFGIGEALKLVIIAKSALTPIAINTERAIASIPKGWLELGRLHRLSFVGNLRRIILPATVLPVFVGLRFGLVQAWAALVVVELLASTRGLGYQLTMSRQLFQLDTMMAVMLVIGVIGLVLDRGLAFVEGILARRYGGLA